MTRSLVTRMCATSLLALALPAGVTGQSGEVTGVIRDATSEERIVGASVILELASDTTRVKTVLTSAAGRFLLVGVSPDRYRLRVEGLAYETLITDAFVVEAESTHDLGRLTLAVEALELDPLAVTAERAAVTFGTDRTSYHIDAMPSAQGSTASELLRDLPELAVDFDGRVTMRGSRTAIHINGRPAPMNGMALTAFLEQFPSEHIERIEVIDNPSARYAAEGSGGIVNIVLREGVELGMTGLAFLRGGTRGQLGGGGRATLQRGPWTLNSGLSINRSSRKTSSFSLRQNLLAEPMTFLEQEASSNLTGTSGNADVEVRYRPTERMHLQVSGRLGGRRAGSEGLTTTTHMDEDRIPTSVYRRSNELDASNLTGRLGAGFNYAWEQRRHELAIELEVDRNRDRDETREGLDAVDLSGATGPLPADLSLHEELQRDGALHLSVDYVRPWIQDGRVELGYRLDAESAESERLLSERNGAQASSRETEVGFGHQQTLNALYLTLQRQLGVFGVQVGVRGERADTWFEVPTGEAFETAYHSLFPSASLSARIGRNRQIRLSYSRRTERPPPSVLNPIDRSTDPLNREVGNPDIEPAKTHAVSLDLSWTSSLGRLRLSPYYRRTGGTWARITLVNQEGVSTRTWDNVASEEHYGATAVVSLPRGERIRGLVSLGANGQVRDASNLADEYSSSSFRWQARANLEVAVTEQLSAESRFAYVPAVDLPQGRSDARLSADLGLRYRFLDRKAFLNVSVQDPLGLQGSAVETRDRAHVQFRRSSQSSRSVHVNMSYAFVPGAR